MVTKSKIDSMPLPNWCPEVETKPAPMPLLLVQAFINTSDAEKRTDLLDDPDTAASWFTSAELLKQGARVTAKEVDRARGLRESLRDLLEGRDVADLTPLRAVAASQQPELRVSDDGTLGLRNPHKDNIDDALFELLLIVRAAQEDGSWSRLKVCANDECRWVFYDNSRNRQGNWCDMAICGNRIKNRQLRARRRR